MEWERGGKANGEWSKRGKEREREIKMIRETEGWGRLSEECREKGKERWIEKGLKGGKECEKKR